MKRFLTKCALLFAIVAMMIGALCVLYRVTPMQRNVWLQDGTANFHAMPQDIEVAVFGPSHTQNAILEGPEGKTYFNFSLSGQTVAYDLALMRQYQKNIKEGALVIVDLSYTTPYAVEDEASFQRRQGRYYRLLDAENIINVDYEEYFRQRYIPILALEPDFLLRSALMCFGMFEINKPVDAFCAEDLEADAQRIEAGVLRNIVNGIYPRKDETTMEAYKSIAELCREKKWNLVFLTTPYLSQYDSCYPDGFYETFSRDVAALAAECDVPYLDYSHAEKFTGDFECFANLDHMNIYGAQKFDEMLWNDLLAQKLL